MAVSVYVSEEKLFNRLEESVLLLSCLKACRFLDAYMPMFIVTSNYKE